MSHGAVEISLTSHSVDQTVAVGRAMAQWVDPGDVIGLIAPLGAGKTQLVRGLAEGLGVDPRAVSSPTFVLMQEYAGRLPLVHIDAYRMNDLSELETIGWSDELLDDAVTVVEWADRIRDQLPSDRLEIELEHVGEHERLLSFRGLGHVAERLANLAELVAEA